MAVTKKGAAKKGTVAKKGAAKKGAAKRGAARPATPTVTGGATGTSTSTSSGSSSSNAALAAAVASAITAVKAVNTQLAGAGLVVLTPEQRQHTNGRIRQGEDEAMTSILETVDAHPGAFQFMAARDHGVDDLTVETQPAYDALARRDLLLPLQTALGQVLQRVDDDMLASGGIAKDVTTQAYRIIKGNVGANPTLRTEAGKAFTFYEGISHKAQATIRAKKAKK